MLKLDGKNVNVTVIYTLVNKVCEVAQYNKKVKHLHSFEEIDVVHPDLVEERKAIR